MNYLLAVMEAVSYSVAAGSNQQLADSKTTIMDVQAQETINNQWASIVSDKATVATKAANALADKPDDKGLSAKLTAAQTDFQNAQTQQQTYTQQADSATQAMQNQAGQDSSTMQQKIQLEAAINQVAQALASALSQHY
jgi:hypothetical protein